MNALLTQAIGQLHLQPGQTYRTTVNGQEVEVRILETKSPRTEVPSQLAEEGMSELYLEIPEPNEVHILRPSAGPADPFDAPILPAEEETAP